MVAKVLPYLRTSRPTCTSGDNNKGSLEISQKSLSLRDLSMINEGSFEKFNVKQTTLIVHNSELKLK
jgi:hypothetical protein